MERCILGSSRYGAWINLKKSHHKVFIYQKLLFTLWCLNLIAARAAYIGFFVPIYNVYLITKDILHRVGM